MARKKKIIKYKMSKLTQNHILVCVDSSQVKIVVILADFSLLVKIVT